MSAAASAKRRIFLVFKSFLLKSARLSPCAAIYDSAGFPVEDHAERSGAAVRGDDGTDDLIIDLNIFSEFRFERVHDASPVSLQSACKTSTR